jgi:diguanylate cyclase (GGDEF)-like protein
LRLQLQSLLEEARLNERKLQRLGQLEKRLIATSSLAELIQTILQDYKSSFDIDIVTLVLTDPEYEITRILDNEKRVSSKMNGLVLLEQAHSDSCQSYLGAFDPDLKEAIFDPWPAGCRSMALLPLIRKNELIGSLNLASCDAERFTPDRSVDFLERLATIISICLENALNHERLKLAGLTDPLTGINNRRYFESRCREEIAYARRHQRPLACMFFDIDKFKGINDGHGHLAGDEVLRNVASLIKSQLRSNDVIARFGGEEFVALLPQIGLRKACEIAERIRTTIGTYPFNPLPEVKLSVTISIGVAALPENLVDDDDKSSQKLISSADGALYQAKKNGRNRVVSVALEN